ncbi:MAG: hypothetical protein LBC74_11275 [Planctomycetaceae bacterium]|jgi:hypothetical protein|nr:hypothetical protein [Planctomycetaceae bacterium]
MKRLFFLFLVVFLLTEKVFAENLIELQFEVNSSEVYFGDTLYIAVYAKNISGKRLDNFPAFNLDHFYYCYFGEYSFYKYFKVYLTQVDANVSFPFYQMQHGEIIKQNYKIKHKYISFEKDAKILFHVIEFPIPSLDAINDKFWSRLLDDSAQDKNKNKFILHIKGKIEGNDISYFDGEINRELTIKPRSKNGMFLMEYWHSTLPPNAFIISSTYPSLKFFSDDYKKNMNYYDRAIEYPLKNHVKSGKTKISISLYFRYSYWSHYPPPYCYPATWEGWKKLEDVFEEGTLQDEIHYTRLCLQYIETKDEGVLDELKKLIARFDSVRQNAIVKRADHAEGNNRKNVTLKKLFETIQNFQP